MAGEVVVDALPYIDQGYDDPGVRDAVRQFYYKYLFVNLGHHITSFIGIVMRLRIVDIFLMIQ